MKYSINIPCRKANLSKIRNFVAGVLRKYGVDDVEVNNLVLAVDEVCANLIIHSYKCDPAEKLEVDIDINSKKITFDIHDHSDGFDIREHPEPALEEIIKSRKKGGVGLLLVKRIMDDIDFIKGDNTRVVRLTKFRS